MAPFQSERQRRYLWTHEPEVAKKWTKKYGSKIAGNENIKKRLGKKKLKKK